MLKMEIISFGTFWLLVLLVLVTRNQSFIVKYCVCSLVFNSGAASGKPGRFPTSVYWNMGKGQYISSCTEIFLLNEPDIRSKCSWLAINIWYFSFSAASDGNAGGVGRWLGALCDPSMFEILYWVLTFWNVQFNYGRRISLLSAIGSFW